MILNFPERDKGPGFCFSKDPQGRLMFCLKDKNEETLFIGLKRFYFRSDCNKHISELKSVLNEQENYDKRYLGDGCWYFIINNKEGNICAYSMMYKSREVMDEKIILIRQMAALIAV